MTLHPRNQTALASAMPSSNVEKSLSSARRFFKSNHWLGKQNRYARDTIKMLATDMKPGRVVNARHLAQYIAVSSLLHCVDSWSYLGRSIQSLLRGDANTALHLAYYAELRAAMSLLACEGIGVFKDWHFVIDGPNSVGRLPVMAHTHGFAWDCLSYWSMQNSSGALFTGVVRPHMRTLDDWLTPVGGGVAIAAQARDWFQQWGMDLQIFADDRDARNRASYRPSGTYESTFIEVTAVAQFVRELWETLEPAAPSNFDGLDRYILRLSLERLFFARTNTRPADNPSEFDRIIRMVIRHQDMTDSVSEGWIRFLKRQVSPADPTVFEHSRVLPNSGANSYFAIIARATLLLRIASGSTAQLFEAAGVRREAIKFWREKIGAGRGLWGGGGEPAILTDLWTDVSASLTDVQQFGIGPEVDRTYHYLGSSFGQVFAPLGSCERVAVWTVAAS